MNRFIEAMRSKLGGDDLPSAPGNLAGKSEIDMPPFDRDELKRLIRAKSVELWCLKKALRDMGPTYAESVMEWMKKSVKAPESINPEPARHRHEDSPSAQV